MAGIHDWLEHVHEPVSPPIMAAMTRSLVPMDRNPSMDFSTDEIIPLGLDEDGNTCFYMPDAWNSFVEPALGVNTEAIPIDPALQQSADPPTFVTVPGQYAEASSKLLVYLARVLDIPEMSDQLEDHEMTFTAEELEVLEPIDEGPGKIGGTRVNRNPQSKEIKEILDHRRVGPDRQTYYLAKTVDDNYYWFWSNGIDRDRQLRKAIGDYHHKSRVEYGRKRTGDAKKLRSGRKIRL
jgi:hypothetical protein